MPSASASPLRARRADTLALARNADPIPVSEAVTVAWARLVSTAAPPASCADTALRVLAV